MTLLPGSAKASAKLRAVVAADLTKVL